MEDNRFEKRMYAMVLRQLSPMQKGIQALHAVVEYSQLMRQYIKVAQFYEPDLDGIMTAFCFIADERIWNAEKYPSLNSYAIRHCEDMNMTEIYSRYAKEIWNNEPFDKYLALRDLIFSKKQAVLC